MSFDKFALVGCVLCLHGCADPATNGDTSEASVDASSASSGGAESEAESSSGESETGGDPLVELSDEFDDPSLEGWMWRHEVEGTQAQWSRREVMGGVLEIEPTTSGWYGDYDGPFMFKLIEGDFVLETIVVVDDRDEPGSAPDELFNSAGLLVRRPDHGPGAENWVMHNLGMQNGEVATEGKTTVDSTSVLTLFPGVRNGRLRVCRIGQDIELARWLDDEDAWNVTHVFPRADFPETLQVGLVVNGWNSGGPQPDLTRDPDLLARFGYARFWTPADFNACTAP